MGRSRARRHDPRAAGSSPPWSRSEEGIADLRAAGRVAEALKLRFMPWRADLAVALPPSSISEARQLAETNLGLALRHGRPATHRDRASHGGGPESRYGRGRPAAGGDHDPPGVASRPELARAQLDLGAALRRFGHPVAARDPLRQALEIASRCGAVPIAERARSEALHTGARPRRSRLSGIHARARLDPRGRATTTSETAGPPTMPAPARGCTWRSGPEGPRMPPG